MNILIIHEVDYLRKVIFEFQTLAELLSLRKHTVCVIDYESMWRRKHFLDFHSKAETVIAGIAYPEATVQLLRPEFIKLPIVSRVSAALSHKMAVGQVIRDRRVDAIILYSVPTNGVQTICAARKLGVPVIFRSIDILHRLVDNPVLARITHQMEKWVYKRADLILAINQSLKRYVIDLGASDDRSRVLPLGIDTVVFSPAPGDEVLRQNLGYGKKDRIIVFVGTLPKFSGLDTFIQAMPRMARIVPDIRLLIVGDGAQRPELERMVEELGLRGLVKITGLVPHSSVPDYINLASVCVMPFRICPTTDDIFPTKVVQYMACGKPVVSSPLRGLQEEDLGGEQGVLYTDMSDPISALVNAMVNQIGLGERAREYAVRVHGYGSVVEQLENEISELVREKGFKKPNMR